MTKSLYHVRQAGISVCYRIRLAALLCRACDSCDPWYKVSVGTGLTLGLEKSMGSLASFNEDSKNLLD